MTFVGGSGLSREEISERYGEWKKAWFDNNPDLGRSAAAEKMNKDMNDHVSRVVREEAKKAKMAKKAKKAKMAKKVKKETNVNPGTFFVNKRVPNGWSLKTHLDKLDKTTNFDFLHKPVSGRVVKFPLPKRERDRLLPDKWFKDTTINAYMALLGGESNPSSSRCLFLPCQFYTKLTGPGVKRGLSAKAAAKARHALVKRWTKDLNTTNGVTIFVPLNHNKAHWSLIEIDVKKKRIISMDSMAIDRLRSMRAMLTWCEQEHLAKGKNFDRNGWKLLEAEVPQQQDNRVDCGVFTCMFAAYRSNGVDMAFTQADMPKMRRRVAWSILNSTLV